MNILQQQNSAKELSDQQLQQELLNPSGALPSYLALSELQRRKDMRASYQSLQGKPDSSMAEEFARGLGGADVGKYGNAVRGMMPSSPGREQPPMPDSMQAPMAPPTQAPMQAPMQDPMQAPQQQFADGGAVMSQRAQGATMAQDDILAGYKKPDGTFNPAALSPLAGVIGGQSVGDSLKASANAVLIGPGLRLLGVKSFADGGPVHYDNGGTVSGNASFPDLWRMITGQQGLPASSGNSAPAITGPFSSVEAANAQEALRPTMAPLAPSGALVSQRSIQDILRGIGITNQRLDNLGIAGAANSNPFGYGPAMSAPGGSGDGNGPGGGEGNGPGGGVGTSAGDASVSGSVGVGVGSPGTDGVGTGTGETYAHGGPIRFDRGGVVGLQTGGNPGRFYSDRSSRFYTDFSNRREDNREADLYRMQALINQSAPKGGLPATNAYGTPYPYVIGNGPPDDSVQNAVESNQYRARVDNDQKPAYSLGAGYYGTYGDKRPGSTPTPMAYDRSYPYPPTPPREEFPPVTYNYPLSPQEKRQRALDYEKTAQEKILSDGGPEAERIKRIAAGRLPYDNMPPSEPMPGLNPFSYLPSQSTYVPYDPNNPDPSLGPNSTGRPNPNSPSGYTDEASFTPGKAPVAPNRQGTQPPPNARRQTTPPGGDPDGGIGSAVNPDLAGFMGQVRGLQLPDRFGEIEARNQQERDDLKAGRESDKGLAMLQAGMTMAGGTSPYALSNIAAGTNAGIREWSSMEKEFRVANQAIRSADNAIAIARANRDEKQLEMGVRVKMHFEEMRQKSLDRAAAASASAGVRADANEDRKARTEIARDAQADSQLTHLASAGQKASTEATSIDVKIAQLKTDALANPENTARNETIIRDLQAKAQQRNAEASHYQDLYQQGVNLRLANKGVVAMSDPSKEGYTINGEKLRNGQRFVTRDGRMGIWKDKP